MVSVKSHSKNPLFTLWSTGAGSMTQLPGIRHQSQCWGYPKNPRPNHPNTQTFAWESWLATLRTAISGCGASGEPPAIRDASLDAHAEKKA